MKVANIILFGCSFLFIGIGMGLALSTIVNVRVLAFPCYIISAGLGIIRGVLTAGKTKFYTQEEYENKGKKIFEFEDERSAATKDAQ